LQFDLGKSLYLVWPWGAFGRYQRRNGGV